MSALADWERLAQCVGEFMHYWGFKRIHGRIWTHLFLSETPLDAAELIRRLRVSKALISISLKDLLQYDVVCEAGTSDEGTQVYIANPQVMDVILNVLRQRERKMLAECQTSYNLLKGNKSDLLKKVGVNQDRLVELGDMIHLAQDSLNHILSFQDLKLEAWKRFNRDSSDDSSH